MGNTKVLAEFSGIVDTTQNYAKELKFVRLSDSKRRQNLSVIFSRDKLIYRIYLLTAD